MTGEEWGRPSAPSDNIAIIPVAQLRGPSGALVHLACVVKDVFPDTCTACFRLSSLGKPLDILQASRRQRQQSLPLPLPPPPSPYADDAMEAAARWRVAAVIDHVVDLHALLLPVVDAFVSPRKALVEKKLKVRCAGNALPDDDFDGGCFHQVAVATGERLQCSHRHCKQPSAHCIDYCGAALSCRIK